MDELNDAADLKRLVATSDPMSLLPSHYQGTGVDGPMSLVAATRMGDSAWLAVLRAASGELFGSPLLVTGSLGDSTSDARVRRAAPGDGVARSLLRVLTAHHDGPGVNASGAGELGFGVTGLNQDAADHIGESERSMLVDQTHAVRSGRRARRGQVGSACRAHPAATLVAHLAEAGFAEMARPWGFVTWDASAEGADGDDGAEKVLLASAAQFLEGAPTAGPGPSATPVSMRPARPQLDSATSPLVSVGELVADLHIAMATSTSLISAPRSDATPSEVTSWGRSGPPTARGSNRRGRRC